MDYLELYRNNKLLRPDREKSPNTLAVYLPALEKLDAYLQQQYSLSLRDERVHQIKGHMLEAYDRHLAAQQYAPSTRNLRLKVIKQYFSYLVRAGYTTYDPSSVLEMVQVKRDEEQETQRGFTPQQVADIIQDARGANALRNSALVALMAGTGLRISEALSLNLSDWQRLCQEGFTYVRIKGGRRVKAPIAPWALPFLRRYVKARKGPSAPDSPLFLSTQNLRLSRFTAQRSVATIQKRLGLKTGLHDLRHTVLTEVKRAAGDISAAQAVAHHTSSRTTQGYVHEQDVALEALSHNRLGDALKTLTPTA